jgi:hypothetical protein
MLLTISSATGLVEHHTSSIDDSAKTSLTESNCDHIQLRSAKHASIH